MVSMSRIFSRRQTTQGEQQRILKCKHCDMIFENKDRLKKHDKKAHTGKNQK